MGSAMLFLAIGIVTYVIVLGFLMQFAPAILGAVFSTIETVSAHMNINEDWQTIQDDVDDQAQFLVPMLFSLLLVLLVIKVLMAAGVRGGD